MVTGYVEKPMMSDEEIKVLDELLEERKPKACLEYGAGGSTIYFPNKHKEHIKYWRAVEHNGHCYNFLEDKVGDNVDLVLSHPHDREEYIKDGHDRRYDFVLIDGMSRKEAVRHLKGLLKKDGVALLHDASREEYDTIIRVYRGKMLCKGELRRGVYVQGGFALFKRRDK